MAVRLRGSLVVASLALAVLVSGCGGGGSSTPPGLPAALGRSATTVQQLEQGSQSVVSGISTGAAHDLDQLASGLTNGKVDAQSVPKIDAVLRSGDAPFTDANKKADHVESFANEIRHSLVPPPLYRSTKGAIRKFVADWENYALVDAVAFDQIAALTRSLVVLRVPLLHFLHTADVALKANDHSAFESARAAYLATVKKLTRSGVLPQPRDLSVMARTQLATLNADKSRSSEVRKLWTTVARRYPLSFFAVHPAA